MTYSCNDTRNNEIRDKSVQLVHLSVIPSTFTWVPLVSKQVCVPLSTSADNMALLAFAAAPCYGMTAAECSVAATVDRYLLLAQQKSKGSPYSITKSRVPELIQVLGSQPAGDESHKPGRRLPLLSARPAVTPATLKRAATNFAAW